MADGDESPTSFLNLQQQEQPNPYEDEQQNVVQDERTHMDQDEQRNTEQSEETQDRPRQKRRGRGYSRMPDGRHVITDVNEDGFPTEPQSAIAPFRTACGVTARDNVAITYRKWKGRPDDPHAVPDHVKDLCWTKIIEVFQFPEGREQLVRKRALKIMCESWNNWKNKLNSVYVMQDRTPDLKDKDLRLAPFWDEFVQYKKSEAALSLSQKNKANSEKNVVPHSLGPGGYLKKLPKWEKREQELIEQNVVPETSYLERRASHFLLARGTSIEDNGRMAFRNERVQELAQKIVEVHVQSSQGSFHPSRENDELTQALGNKEHPGRTRGVGMVPWKAGFPDALHLYKRPKKGREDDVEARINERVDERVAHLMAQRDREIELKMQRFQEQLLAQTHKQADDAELMIPSPGARKSSQASVVLPDEEGVDHPVDHITEPTKCSLHVFAAGTTLKVAEGQAFPTSGPQILHTRPIPPGFAKVCVDNVLQGCGQVHLEVPGQDGNNKLGQNLGGFIAWRKRDIKFTDEEEVNSPPTASSPPRRIPTPPSPPRRIPTPPSPPRRSPPQSTQPRRSPTPPRQTRRSGSSKISERSSKKSSGSLKSTAAVKKLAYEKTDAELAKEVQRQVHEHFKKKEPPVKNVVDSDTCAFFTDMAKVYQTGSREKRPQDQSDYERGSRKAKTKQGPPLRWPFNAGTPLIHPDDVPKLSTQMRRLHEWYVRYHHVTSCTSFPILYKEEDFYNGDGNFYVEFSELYQLYHQDALDISLLKLWIL
jgi:hypothetical protein